MDRLCRHSGKGVFTLGPQVIDHDNNSNTAGVSDGAMDCDRNASAGGDDAVNGDTDRDSDIGTDHGI